MNGDSVDCVVTSPPYWGLRDYGADGQLGLEESVSDYVQQMTKTFAEIKRVLKSTGTVWLNLGDTYKNKQLMGVPWRVAFALQDDGWFLRQEIIWHKPNPMPESVTDRCTKASESIFLLAKSSSYFFDAESIKEENAGSLPYGDKKNFKMNDNRAQGRHGKGSMFSGGSRQEYIEKYYLNGRNRRSVWTITTQPFSGAHFAVFPEEIPRLAILAGCPVGGTVLDPFSGSGTTGKMALKNGRNYIGLDINDDYFDVAERRVSPLKADVAANDNQLEMF
ncbi:MAG TPA: site-specific DNA-methyltransferase [Alteromonas macleodii]|nr:site-specific DNA-methyltransferase [Alteromonas macleodii]HAM19222.1 site-specific DNA-methyltransferase [Alteromonas macleodii]